MMKNRTGVRLGLRAMDAGLLPRPACGCPSCFCHPDQRWAGQGLHRRASDRGGAMVVTGGDGVIDLSAVRERLKMLERSDGATPTALSR